MSALAVVALGVVGGLGAIARFALDGAVAGRLGREFPYGTLVVNLSGALALGVVVGAGFDEDAYRLAGTGLLGSYTTFSTWALESHRLGEDGRLSVGGLNFAVSLVLGVVAAWAGSHLGAAL
jgi:fluoride exporter